MTVMRGCRLLPYLLAVRSTKENLDMKTCRVVVLLLAMGGLAMLSTLAKAQALADSPDSPSAAVVSTSTTHPQADFTYTRPTEKTRLQTTSSTPTAPIPSSAPQSLPALTSSIIRRPSGNKARRATASDLGPTSASQRSPLRRAMRLRKPFTKRSEERRVGKE